MTSQPHTRREISPPVLASLLFCILGIAAHADIPQKAPLTRYTGLWTNSPFTTPPPPPEAAPTVNPFENYTLSGIAPVPGGYRITLLNKTNPEERRVIEPGIANEFTVVAVNRNPEKALGTTVVLSSGALQGTVSFEPELLALRPPPPPQQVQQGNLPPGVNPVEANQQQQQQNAGEPQRQPRPRIVPPPTPQGQPQPQAQQQGGGARVQGQGGRGERRGDRRR